MPATSSSEQLFEATTNTGQQQGSPPIESASMLLSVVSEYVLDYYRQTSIRSHLSQTAEQLENKWQSFLESSWANHWLPEVQYLRGFTLFDVFVWVAIGLVTSSWYTIRNDRKNREQQQQQQQELQTKNDQDDSKPDKDIVSKESPTTPNPTWLQRYKNLPTLDIGDLGFSTGTSWERRYQTAAMFSCSLAFVMPGMGLCWAAVVHFGLLLPLHVWKDSYSDNQDNNASDVDEEEVPILYQLRILASCLLVWIYLLYCVFVDTSPTSGIRTPWVRNRFQDWWKHACDFLPVVLVKTADLPAFHTATKDGTTTVETPARYLMGYHPHGIIAVGAFCAFATDGARVLDLSNNKNKHDNSIGLNDSGILKNSTTTTSSRRRATTTTMGMPLRPSSLSLLDDDDDNEQSVHSLASSFASLGIPRRGFSSLFPGLDRRIVTLPVNFKTPFLREYLLAMGAVTSERATFRTYLNPSHSNPRAMVVVVGGAAESMLAHEGHIELVLKHRRGFVREAILANASLVPVLGFGETNLYTLYDDLEGDQKNEASKHEKPLYPTSPVSIASAFLSVFQNFARDTFGVAVPLFRGRSVFFKSLGVMPRRRPVVVVVGKPIPPPTVEELGDASVFSPKIDRATEEPLNDHGKVLLEWHSKYVHALEELYNEYKDAPWNSPGKGRDASLKIVR